MTPTNTIKLLTAEEFARLPEPDDGSREELVRGVVESSPPIAFLRRRVRVSIIQVLGRFLDVNPIGDISSGCGVITERDPDTGRGPDVSYWSFERLPRDHDTQGYIELPADLIIEVRSPSDSRRRLRAKVKEYLFNGVKMVWVADPEDHTVTIYRQPDEGRELGEDATLTGEDVLPGFSCRVAELFA